MNEANHDSFAAIDAPALADEEALRPIAWPELTARLAAQRELALLMRPSGWRRPTSFGKLGSLDDIVPAEHGKRQINQHALSNGKIAGGIAASHPTTAATGDRGYE